MPLQAKVSFTSVASQWLPGKPVCPSPAASQLLAEPLCAADPISLHATPNGSASETTDPGLAKWSGWYATVLPGGPVPDLPSVQDVWEVRGSLPAVQQPPTDLRSPCRQSLHARPSSLRAEWA